MNAKFICLLIAALSWAVPATASARELKVAFSQYTPPYVFENGTGIVVDIVKTALEQNGDRVTPVYAPIGRVFKLFAEKQVDATTIIQESSGLAAAYSAVFMQYHNRAFALKSQNLSIKRIADLKDRSVVAFQSADRYLGDEFGRMTKQNSRYKELAQQDAQTQLLFLGRTDVVVMDESIFHFYRAMLLNDGKIKDAEYVAFDVFPPTPYKAAFNDAKLRDDFDRNIAAMRKDGRYDAVYRKYAERYFTVRK